VGTSKQSGTGNGTGGEPKGSTAGAKHLHTIDIDALIVHRYADAPLLLKKADKVARAFIEGELRDGEAYRALRTGVFQLYFPKLTREAGELRSSVMAEQLARAIKDINPASAALENTEAPIAERRREAKQAAHHEAGTRAIARMAEATSTEDVAITEWDRTALSSLKTAFQPVWHTKNNVITGYYCQLLKDGKHLALDDVAALLEQNSKDVAAAKIDAAVYKQAALAVEFLLKQGLKALLIVPIHFSTVDRLRFMGLLLEGGRHLPDGAQNFIVFDIMDIPSDVTGFRLREPVSYLKTRSRALIAQTGFEPADLEMYKELGFHGISIELARYEWKEARLLKGFERFVEDAERQKLQSFVHGISSKSLVVAAIAAGVRYMDGDAVSEPVSHPRHIRPYEIDMLYEE
jgi:hypothetical protein